MEINQWIRVDSLVNICTDLEKEDWYPSRVLEVSSNSFFIYIPQKKTIRLALEKDQMLRVSIPSDQGLFLLNSQVLKIIAGTDPCVELAMPQEIVRVERRKYARLPIRLQVYYAEIREKLGDLFFNTSYSVDISGGGMRMETNRKCPTETLLRIKFSLPGGRKQEEFTLVGRIIRSFTNGETGRLQAGIEFIDISTREQESLIRFVLDHMSETGMDQETLEPGNAEGETA